MNSFLEMRNITRSFRCAGAGWGFVDLQRASCMPGRRKRCGEIELMKILGGVYPFPEYGGEIVLEGNLQSLAASAMGTCRHCRDYQELSLVKEMTLAKTFSSVANLALWVLFVGKNFTAGPANYSKMAPCH